MPFVELTTNVDNLFSQRVILKNDGALHEKFVKPQSSGGGDGLRYLIYMQALLYMRGGVPILPL